jgi:uncharacterized membrane protein
MNSVRNCDNFSHSRSRHESTNIYFHRQSSASVSLNVVIMEWIIVTVVISTTTTTTTAILKVAYVVCNGFMPSL